MQRCKNPSQFRGVKDYFGGIRNLGRKESGKMPPGGCIWAIPLRREGIWSCRVGDKWQGQVTSSS